VCRRTAAGSKHERPVRIAEADQRDLAERPGFGTNSVQDDQRRVAKLADLSSVGSKFGDDLGVPIVHTAKRNGANSSVQESFSSSMIPIMNLRSGLIAATLVGLAGCAGAAAPAPNARPQIVVTFSVLGAVVGDLVGDAADVVVLMPNGVDPHEWKPSAKDIERISRADLFIENGLGLEGNLSDVVGDVTGRLNVFVVAEHVTIRTVGAGEGADPMDPDQAEGADDPHLWMDPMTVKQMVAPLAAELGTIGIDVSANVAGLQHSLEVLDQQIKTLVAAVPVDQRKLITGHESMGYFADRYGFQLVGALTPTMTSQAAASAGVLARMIDVIEAQHVPAIFAELGTPAATVRAIASDTGTQVVQMSTHQLPSDATYQTFMMDIATTITEALA
jgi:zinc/manganese transport system substrate-binding protein